MTVVLVNWNGDRFLDRCLSALLAQTVIPHEIILVDNASSDASLNMVRHYPSVRLLAQNENLGFARGNNVAIEAAATESEWIALLNPDAFPELRWVDLNCRAMLQAHLSNRAGLAIAVRGVPEVARFCPVVIEKGIKSEF